MGEAVLAAEQVRTLGVVGTGVIGASWAALGLGRGLQVVIAVADEDGFLTIVDRVKDMYISGGENVYPAEVEQEIYRHPAVAEVAVVGVPDERWGEVGRAVVVRREGADVDEAGLIAHLDCRLARYKLPKSVVFVEELPHNASGKLLKSKVRERYAADRGGAR